MWSYMHKAWSWFKARQLDVIFSNRYHHSVAGRTRYRQDKKNKTFIHSFIFVKCIRLVRVTGAYPGKTLNMRWEYTVEWGHQFTAGHHATHPPTHICACTHTGGNQRKPRQTRIIYVDKLNTKSNLNPRLNCGPWSYSGSSRDALKKRADLFLLFSLHRTDFILKLCWVTQVYIWTITHRG